MNIRVLIMTFVGIVLLSMNVRTCEKSPYDAYTKVFREYMLENFKLQVEQSTHYYFISNTFVCRGCVQRYLYMLNDFLDEVNGGDDITLITTVPYDVLSRLRSKICVLVDKQRNLDYENLDLNNLNLFVTKDGEIGNVRRFSTEDENEFRTALSEIMANRIVLGRS